MIPSPSFHYQTVETIDPKNTRIFFSIGISWWREEKDWSPGVSWRRHVATKKRPHVPGNLFNHHSGQMGAKTLIDRTILYPRLLSYAQSLHSVYPWYNTQTGLGETGTSLFLSLPNVDILNNCLLFLISYLFIWHIAYREWILSCWCCKVQCIAFALCTFAPATNPLPVSLELLDKTHTYTVAHFLLAWTQTTLPFSIDSMEWPPQLCPLFLCGLLWSACWR